MHIFVAITDFAWYQTLARMARTEVLDEVNFWRPSNLGFSALEPGEILLFKLHAPYHAIVGGGFFTRASHLPLRLAWETFGRANGAESESDMATRMQRYAQRRIRIEATDFITCLVLSEPFFFAEGNPIAVPPSFARSVQVGKRYSTDETEGRRLFAELQRRLTHVARPGPGPATEEVAMAGGGTPRIVIPRLGQGGFRVTMIEAYNRRCAMTGERTLPALEAAHIRPYTSGGGHDARNGLLLRRDLHSLFDQGYVTVDPGERRIVVSGRIRSEFENGRDYYALHGKPLGRPREASSSPAPELLQYHAEHVFRG